MKKLLAVCATAVVLGAVQTWASADQFLLVPRSGLRGSVERLPPGVWAKWNDSETTPLGSVTLPLSGQQFMVDPANNVLVLVVRYNPDRTQGNFSFSLQEWTADGTPYNRDGEGPEIMMGGSDGWYGRVFTSRNRATFHGVCDLYEGNAARAGEDEVGPPLALGDHSGACTVAGTLDKNGNITGITISAIGEADILNYPEEDDDQLTMKFTIHAGLPPQAWNNNN